MEMLLNAIRKAIESSKVTRYRIAAETGISQPQLCRLMNGKTGLSIEAFERLADFLELEIIIRPRRQRKGK